MDPSVLTQEQQAQWAEFERNQQLRREIIGRAAKILGVQPVRGDALNHVTAKCPICGTDANRRPGNSLMEDESGNYFRSMDMYEGLIAWATSRPPSLIRSNTIG